MIFIVAPGMGVNYALGTDAAFPRFLARYVLPGMTVYDIGANKGQMALYFASLVGKSGRVIAFEPAPSEFKQLQKNIELNALEFVTANNVAVAEKNGEMKLQYDSDHPTQGKLTGVEPTYTVVGDVITVTGVCLDTLVSTYDRPDFIKVDVEGAAANVLRGATRIIQQFAPHFYLELHGPEEQRAVKELLLANGYVAEDSSGHVVLDPTIGWHSPLFCYKRPVGTA